MLFYAKTRSKNRIALPRTSRGILARASQKPHVAPGPGWVGIEQVEHFVLKNTPFSEAIHLKRLTLKPMELEGDIKVRRPSGSPNRPGDYPAGTRIRFV
jgi:hypothetical protein